MERPYIDTIFTDIIDSWGFQFNNRRNTNEEIIDVEYRVIEKEDVVTPKEYIVESIEDRDKLMNLINGDTAIVVTKTVDENGNEVQLCEQYIYCDGEWLDTNRVYGVF